MTRLMGGMMMVVCILGLDLICEYLVERGLIGAKEDKAAQLACELLESCADWAVQMSRPENRVDSERGRVTNLRAQQAAFKSSQTRFSL
ncbi:hypothetical protein F4819DRAFT_313161, partial [Hypoxylon fuscum]